VTAFGDNTNPNPFEILDAREAQYSATKHQRAHVDKVAKAHDALADAEYTYRTALSARWKQLREEGWAATVCGDIARGEESIAQLRCERDKRQGELRALEEDSYRIAADRRGLDGLIAWSKDRDLRVDAEPGDWSQQKTFGRGVPEGVDPQTGELRSVA
jgi:hypothetical protein